jgi:hypothetical protein
MVSMLLLVVLQGGLLQDSCTVCADSTHSLAPAIEL